MSVKHVGQGHADGARADSPLVARLAGHLERLATSERRLKALLREAYEQIDARDEELDRLRQKRDEMYRAAAAAHAHLAEVKRTRVWRVGTTYWLVRDWLLRRRRT